MNQFFSNLIGYIAWEHSAYRKDKMDQDKIAHRMICAVERDVTNLYEVAMIKEGVSIGVAKRITDQVQDQLAARLKAGE